MNGVPAIYFANSKVSYGLTVPAGSLDIAIGESRTIFLVLERGSGEVFGPNSGYRIGIGTDGSVGLRNHPNAEYMADAQLQVGVPYILAVVAQAGSPINVSVYRNGELVVSTNIDCALYSLIGDVGIGWPIYTGSPGRNFLNGRLAEVVVFDRALDPTDHTTVGQYLSLKYAITSLYVPTPPTVVTVPGEVIRRNTSAVLAGEPDSVADIRFLWSTNGTLGETLSGWDGTNLVTDAAPNMQVNGMATNLLPATPYYWRCFASNANGVGWSPTTNSFTTHASPVGVVQPPVTAGLVLNLDPASLICTNNESMDWWPDASGSDADFTTMAANNQPKFTASVAALADKPVVSFASGGRQLGNASIPAVGTGTNRTAFLVIIPKTGSGGDLFGSGSGQKIGLDVTSARVALRNYDVAPTAYQYSATNSLPLNLPHIVAVTDEGGADPATRIYVDGVEGTPYLYGDATSTDRMFEWSMAASMAVGGANYASREYVGDVAQVLVYGRVLTTIEQNAVGVFLQTKYGLNGAYLPPVGTVILIQ